MSSNVYEGFIAEVEALTIMADMPAVAVVGELTRAVKRAQNAWDEADLEGWMRATNYAIAQGMCTCGHWPHQHDPEADPFLCMVCGDNTRCNYADAEAVAADRWDEGYLSAVTDCCPDRLVGPERVLWSLAHMPKGNPYREASA